MQECKNWHKHFKLNFNKSLITEKSYDPYNILKEL